MITQKNIVGKPGQRLDAAVLAAFPSSTRAFVREAVECGDILVDGRRAAKGLKLRGGERIAVRELAEAADNTVAPNPAIAVNCVYEDNDLLAFDKPSGQPVQPLSRSELTTLMNGVVALHPECIPLGDSPLMAGALHRIDADTSGLVLVARTAAAFENLRAQFAAQTVEKTYLALVEGSVPMGKGPVPIPEGSVPIPEGPVPIPEGPVPFSTLENDLIHDPTLPFCRMIDVNDRKAKGLSPFKCRVFHAVTAYRPIGQTIVENETRTLLEVKIFTGVTHQIRAQLALAGMHIVNDRLYGAFAIENQTGHCLHALSATFRHPRTDEAITLRTPLPGWAHVPNRLPDAR